MYAPYFDQQKPDVEIVGMIADLDTSQEYEMDACAVFKAKKGYLVVIVSGCSCWPDYGGTEQKHCLTKADVDRAITGRYRELLDKCQEQNWKIDKTRN